MATNRVYDPVKRREYYLRTRQLKGRKKASPQVNFETLRTRSRGMGGANKRSSEQGVSTSAQFNQQIKQLKAVRDKLYAEHEAIAARMRETRNPATFIKLFKKHDKVWMKRLDAEKELND